MDNRWVMRKQSTNRPSSKGKHNSACRHEHHGNGDRRAHHAIGFVDYYEIGAGLAAPAQLAFVTGLTLDGAVMFGEEVRGWTIGFGLAF